MHTWQGTNGRELPKWARAAIPLFGMLTGIVWAIAFIYITKQVSKIRIKKLELKELELRSKMA